MKKEEQSKIKELVIDCEELEKDFNDRISEYHNVKGMQSERHAFCYYRQQTKNRNHYTNKDKTKALFGVLLLFNTIPTFLV